MARKLRKNIWIALSLASILALGGAINCTSETDETGSQVGDELDGTDPGAEPGTEPGTEPGDETGSGTPGTPGTPGLDGSEGLELLEQGNTALTIRVMDADGEFLKDATVSVRDYVLNTNEAGFVRFMDLQPGKTVAIINADGHAPVTVVADVLADVNIYREARLLPWGEMHTISADQGGEVVTESVRVVIPAEGVVDADGNVVTGDIQMTIIPLDPTTDAILSAPGPLVGIPEGGSEPVDFLSIFMAEISLWQNGESVNMRPGFEAEVEFMIPASLQDDYVSGDTIEAWWYNLEEGIWHQNGYGLVAPSAADPSILSWTISAPHFSWINCDVPWSRRNCVIVTVLEDGTYDNVAGAMVSASGTPRGGRLFRHAATNSDGYTCVEFLQNSTIDIKAVHPNYRSSDSAVITGNSVTATCSGQGSGECFGATLMVR